MARFLFVVPPLNGHVSPTVAVAAELTRRGHHPAWVGLLDEVRHRLPEGATTFALDDPAHRSAAEQLREARRQARGPAALKLLWEGFFIPLARAMRPGVEAAVARFAPDVLVVDQQALAGGLVARQRRLPWATSATTVAGVVDPLGGLPRVKAWLEALTAALQIEQGVEPWPDPALSPRLVLCFWSRLLVGAAAERLPAAVRFVGPSLGPRPDDADDFPWDWLEVPGHKRLLISLGTVNADTGARFYREAIAAVADLPAQVVVAAPRELLPERLPANVLARAWVPQLRLLPRLDAVVCHGGQNTVAEALGHGLPLVIAPIKDDQPLIAQQVVDVGAGLRVRFGRVRAPRLREAIERALDEPALRASARCVQADLQAAGGAVEAARLLEDLAA